MDEIVTHAAYELVAVDLVLIPVLFAFPFLADLPVHILLRDQYHGGGKYGRPEILLEGVLRFPGEVFQLESVLQQIVGVLYASSEKVYLPEILSLVLGVIGDHCLHLARAQKELHNPDCRTIDVHRGIDLTVELGPATHEIGPLPCLESLDETDGSVGSIPNSGSCAKALGILVS